MNHNPLPASVEEAASEASRITARLTDLLRVIENGGPSSGRENPGHGRIPGVEADRGAPRDEKVDSVTFNVFETKREEAVILERISDTLLSLLHHSVAQIDRHPAITDMSHIAPPSSGARMCAVCNNLQPTGGGGPESSLQDLAGPFGPR